MIGMKCGLPFFYQPTSRASECNILFREGGEWESMDLNLPFSDFKTWMKELLAFTSENAFTNWNRLILPIRFDGRFDAEYGWDAEYGALA